MALRDGSGTEFYKDTLFGWVGATRDGINGWMGTRLAFPACMGITDALARGTSV